MASPQHLVMAAALVVAADPSAKRPTGSRRAYVRWDAVERLRDALETAGIDWKTFKAEHADQN